MEKIIIYHNPGWNKSRNSLRILEKSNKDFEIIYYLKNPPSVEDLKNISGILNLRPKKIVRKKEQDFLKNKIGSVLENDNELFKLMNQYPKIIERPIILIGNKGCIGRPPDNILKII